MHKLNKFKNHRNVNNRALSALGLGKYVRFYGIHLMK